MNIIKINNVVLKTDKYVFISHSMAGTKILGVFDTEKELAYVSFAKEFYKTNILNSVCTYHDLYNPEGKRLNSNELDEIVEKYFPEETQIIKKRMSAFYKIGFKQLIDCGLMDFWLDKQKQIIANLPEDTKQLIAEIEEKSKNYINSIFPSSSTQKNRKI